MTSPAKFKKDKEIIAEYDTQVKDPPSVARRETRADHETSVHCRFFQKQKKLSE